MRGIKESIAIGVLLTGAAFTKDSCGNNGCRQERAVQPAQQQEQQPPLKKQLSTYNSPRIPVDLLEQQPEQQSVDKELERIHCAATRCLS